MNQRLTDIRRAQLDQLLSGGTNMAGGGLLKAVVKAAKPAVKAVQEVLPLAEREANLAKFLAPSAEKRRMYHGSKEPNIKEFKTRKDLTDESHMTGHYADERDAVFLAPEPEFTKNFSQMGYTDTHQAPTTYPVYVQVKNPFDFDNPEHLQRVKDTYLDMYHNPDSELYDPYLSPSERSTSQHLFKKRVDELPSDVNNWPRIENEVFQNVLKDLGFDSFYTRERGTKNLGVYDPNRIKSAIGNRGTYDTSVPDINEAQGGLVHLAGGGRANSDYTLMGAPRQDNENKPYPKTERMNLGVKAVKSGLDKLNRLIDTGPSVGSVVGNVVGAVPFVGPDLRKGMEDSTLTIPYEFQRSATNPRVATGVNTAKVPTTDILDALKMSDLTGGTGASNLLGSVGKGYVPNSMDVLDTLGLGLTGYGAAKAGVRGVKGVKDALLAGKEAKAAKEIETAGTKYATQQEGPFFRVQPTTLGKDAATTRGTKEADGLRATPAVAGGAEPTGRKVPQLLSPEEVGRIIADPVANQPLNIAKKYTQDTQGVDFGVPKTPSSSLAKQSGIARTFDLAVQGSPEYKSAIFGAYSREMPDLMEQIGAKNYDDLMEKAYRQMAKETDDQFKRLPYNFSYHRAGEGNYNGAKDMAADVHGNRHLYVYQGGDKHDFLHNVDPQTGLNENEKFRAVHDLLGHAIYGNEFGPKGEEMAWAVHQQMYSPLARMAMTAETRGQNSVVNYSPLNAKLKKTIAEYEGMSNEARRRGDKALVKEIEDLKRQAYSGLEFAPNRAVLLPPEFMNPQFAGGMPSYLKAANLPTKGTETGSVLTHYSNEPNLQLIDPTRYGTGIKGAEAGRLRDLEGGVRDRSYFYLGEPGTVAPEAGLGGNRYRGESSSLYDITQDPLDFRLLAREANRTPFTARVNAGVTYPMQEANDYERLVKEYGYEGMINPNATKPMGIMFEPTKVEPRMAGGGLLSKLGKAAKAARAAEELVPAAGRMRFADQPMGGLNVIKETGGNWLGGRVEKDVAPLRSRGPTHRDEALMAGGRYAQEADTPEGIRAMAANAALNKWVDGNLSNYIKKQMGTPDDPVRALAEQGITHKADLLREDQVFADKPIMDQRREAGFPEEGMAQSPLAKAWEYVSDSSIPSHRAGDIQGMPEKFTKRDEAERKMIALRDALYHKFIDHLKSKGISDEEANIVARGTPFDLKARAVGDQDFLQAEVAYAATHDPMMSSYIALGQENPWISKVAPETQVYSSFTGDLGFDHIVDVLKQDVAEGRIRPEQLNKVSMEQAVRRTYEYDQEMAKKMQEAAIKQTEGMPVHKEYPEGYKWVELTAPKDLPEGWSAEGNNLINPNGGRPGQVGDSSDPRYKALEDALKYEGDTMGHCVGGYCPDVVQGRSRIYSLRDSKGEPHVTVETRPGAYTPFDIPEDIKPIYKQHMVEGISTHGGRPGAAEWMQHFYPDRFVAPPEDIIQIKGKQNRAPKEEYLPFVQDFVKSGDWSRIGDLKNTGLRDIKKTPKIEEYLKKKGADVPRYLTENEYQGHESDFLMDQLYPKDETPLPPAESMAGGGSVGLKNALNNLLRTDKPEVHMAGGGAMAKVAKAAKAAYSPKVLNSTIEKFVAKIAADNPKLSEEDVLKKATKQATSKLEWERVQKPELEKTYGPLVKTPYSKTNVNKMQNTAEVVAERKRKANEFLDQPTEPWTPPAPELQAFDRSSIKDALEGFPGVEQTAFPRDIPTRASTSHVDELYADPENRALIEKQIKRGLPLGGETFYASLYPVKQAVLEAGMPAEKFDRWIHSLAPASARNSIMNEMAVGQFMRDMNARGIPLTEENVAREKAVYKEKFGISLPLMPLHREGVAKVIEGGQDLREMSKANIPTNYKIPTYGSQKAGDFANSVVLDVHEAGGQTQGSRFHPYFNEQGGFGNTEYNAGEQGLLGIAGDLGIPGGMAQAGRWFGGGELTGLRSPRGDALDLLEKQVAYTLNKKGIQPNPANVRAEVLRQIETGEGDLLPWYRKEGMPDVRQTGLQRKEGGEVTMEGGLTHCKTKKVKRHGNTVPH